MNKRYKSEAHRANHETALGLYKIGVISAAEMKEFDNTCLIPDDRPMESPARSQKPIPAYAKNG